MACVFAAVAFIEAAVIGGVTYWLELSQSTTTSNATEANFSNQVAQAMSMKRISSIPENLPPVGLHITPFIAPATPIASSLSKVPGEPTYSTTISPWAEHVHSSAWNWGAEILAQILISIFLILLCRAASDCIDQICTIWAPKLYWPFSSTTTLQKQLEQEIKELRTASVALKGDNENHNQEIARLGKALEALKGHNEQLEVEKEAATQKVDELEKTVTASARKHQQELEASEKDRSKTNYMLAEEVAKVQAFEEESKNTSALASKKLMKAKKEAEDAWRDYGKMQEQLNAVHDRTQELEIQLKDVQVQKSHIVSQLDGARTQVGRLEKDKALLELGKSWLESDNEQLTNICLTLQRNIGNKNTTAIAAIAEAEGLKTQLDIANGNLETERDQKERFETKVEVIRMLLRPQIEQSRQLAGDYDDLTYALNKTRSSIEQEAQAMAQDLLNVVWDDMLARHDKLLADMQHLETQNDKLNYQVDLYLSQLCKRCVCKRSDGSTGSKDDGDDDNGHGGHEGNHNDGHDGGEDEGARDSPDASNDQGPATGSTVGLPKSSNQQDDSAPTSDDANIGATVKDSGVRPGPSDNVSPITSDSASYLRQVKDSLAGSTARSPQPVVDNDAPPPIDADASNSQSPAASSSSPPCPYGSLHKGCTYIFLPHPGFADLRVNQQRTVQRTFARRRQRVGCAYVAYAELHPDAPIPPPITEPGMGSK